MKPYEWDKRLKAYKIKDAFSLKYPVGGGCPTKNSVGLAYTQARSGHHNKSDDILALNVRGTTDKLRKKTYTIGRRPCTFCGCNCKGKLALKKNLTK